jgi:hypothetical protein
MVLFFVSCAAIASLIALNLVAWQNYSASEPVAGPEPRGTVETSVASGSAVDPEPNAVVSTSQAPGPQRAASPTPGDSRGGRAFPPRAPECEGGDGRLLARDSSRFGDWIRPL